MIRIGRDISRVLLADRTWYDVDKGTFEVEENYVNGGGMQLVNPVPGFTFIPAGRPPDARISGPLSTVLAVEGFEAPPT
jgi:hypothetical protein